LKKGASSFKGRQRRLCLCGILLEIAGVRFTNRCHWPWILLLKL